MSRPILKYKKLSNNAFPPVKESEKAAGFVDSDYRGNVGVVLFNFGEENFFVHKGDRIAQLICEKIEYAELEEVKNALSITERGDEGFGSTRLTYSSSGQKGVEKR